MKKKPAAPKTKKVTKKALTKKPKAKYRVEFDKYDIRDRIPALITDDVLLDCCKHSLNNRSYVMIWGNDKKYFLNEKTDPKAFYRRAIGAMHLSHLDDFNFRDKEKFAEDIDDFCTQKNKKEFQSMIDSIPDGWNVHSLIDLHWEFLREGQKRNPELYDIVDKYLQEENYGSCD